MLRLDYISCLLTVVSTILIGRRSWQGWIVAGVNSIIVCVIGMRTAHIGFIPANLFCIAIYGIQRHAVACSQDCGSFTAAAQHLIR